MNVLGKSGLPKNMEIKAKEEAERLSKEIYAKAYQKALKDALENAFIGTQRAVYAQIAYVMWDEYGWGEKRLKKLFTALKKQSDKMQNEIKCKDAEDIMYFCETVLNQCGIDIREFE